MRNSGNVVVSLSQLGRALAERAEGLGAMVLAETAATRLLVEDGAAVGVRTGDKGRGRDGEELAALRAGLRHAGARDDPRRGERRATSPARRSSTSASPARARRRGRSA